MTDSDSFSTTQQEAYSSVEELRTANSELLQNLSDLGKASEFLPAIEVFIQRGQATGALIDADQDRWDSQRLLDYWATMIYRTRYRPGLKPIRATLAPFDEDRVTTFDNNLCPYLGLNAFQEGNADKFFGRRKLVDLMLKRLRATRFLAVVGPSGSGKSSIVRAGIIPRLKREFTPRFMVPGSEPLANLARLLLNDVSPELIKGNEKELVEDPQHLLKKLDSFSKPSVLCIDQFEEVFTLCESVQARKALTDNLLEVIKAENSYHLVIVTMRIDYEPFVARLDEFYKYFSAAEERVPPLNPSELQKVIELPAKSIGLEFEDGVVDNLLQDMRGEPAALPLLQFTLRELWNRRRFNRITMEAYEELGGGRQALARVADAIFTSLTHEAQSVMKAIFLRLVRPGIGLEVTSNRVTRESLYQDYPRERVTPVLDQLISAGLIRLTRGQTPADDQVEVAHEALVRNWPTLVDWLDVDRPAIIRRRQLETKALEWVRLGRGKSGLLDVVQLAEAKQWLESKDASRLGFNKILPDLVVASEKELGKNNRNLYLLIAVLVVLVFLSSLGAVLAYQKWKQAQRNYDLFVAEQTRAKTEEIRLEQEKVQAVETEQKRLENYQKSKTQPLQQPEKTTANEDSTSNINLWDNGSTIRILFMDGDPIVQKKVEAIATEWTKYANLKFEFVPSGNAEIRISFARPGSWSMLGKTALQMPQDQPTMNFGWFTPDTPDEEYSLVVLHEFGHALGLIAEHQNPNADLPWDKAKVYAYFERPPNNWPKSSIDAQIFKKYNYKNYRPFDPLSVMTHALPKELFNGDFQVRRNSTLSESDKSFIAKLYPK